MSKPDPAAHGQTFTPTGITDESRRQGLAKLADTAEILVSIIGFLTVAGGAGMILAGKWEADGGFLSDPIVYQLRPAGFVIVALGLLLAPTCVVVVRAAKVWALSPS